MLSFDSRLFITKQQAQITKSQTKPKCLHLSLIQFSLETMKRTIIITAKDLKMSFEDSYSAVFMVYRVFGLVPYKFHFQSINAGSADASSTKNRHIRCLFCAERFWFICSFLFEIYNLIHNSILCYKNFTHMNKINTFNVYRLLVIIIIRPSIIVITIESYCHQNIQVKILSNLHAIDRIFAQQLKLQINHHRLKRSIFVAFLKWISISVLVISILIATSFIDYEYRTIEDEILLVLSLYPLLKKALFGSAYVTYAILMKCRLQAMHDVLDSNLLLAHESPSFEVSIDRESRREHEAFEFQRLIHLWRIFARTHDTIQLMNDTFKWSITANFFVNVFDICVMIFHYIDRVFGPHMLIYVSYVGAVSFAFYYVFCFAAIIQVANSVAAEAEKIAPKIHRLSLNGTISDELQHFVSKT